jgi:hypothetical protein
MMALKPIRFFVYLGFTSTILGLVFAILSYFNYDFNSINFDLLIFIYLSVIIFSIGLVGEYIVTINSKVNENLKLQVIKKINIDQK